MMSHRENAGSNAAATMESQSYSQCRSGKDIYEVHWRDDVSEDTSMTKRGGNVDEARL